MTDLTARFGADFANFHAAVESATATLVDFEKGSNNVQASLDRMTASFSGRDLIQQADVMTAAIEDLGGASKLTEAELARVSATVGAAVEKMDKMGIDVPDRMRSLAKETEGAGKEVSGLGVVAKQVGTMIASAFTVDAIVSFAKEAIIATAALGKVATQTGMTTDEVQKLQYVASQTSVDFGKMVSASQNLEAALGGRDKGVAAGLRLIGINLDEFMQLNSYQHIEKIADALKTMGTQTEYAEAARAIFGPAWREMTPALLSDFQAIADKATLSTAETIKAMDDAIAKYDSYMLTAKAVAAGTIQGFGQMADAAINFVTVTAPTWAKLGTLMSAGATDVVGSSAALTGALAAIPPAVIPVGKALNDVALDTWEMATAEEELNKKLEASAKAAAAKETADLAAAMDKARAKGEEWSNAVGELDAAGNGWRETLSTINPEIVAHIQNELAAGKSAEALAIAWGINKTTMTAYKDSVKETNEVLAETARMSTELSALIAENTGSDLERSIAAINRDAELYEQSIIKKKIWTQELSDFNDAIRQERIRAETLDFQALDDASSNALRDMATTARATADEMEANWWKYSASAIIRQQDIATAAEIAAQDWSTSFDVAGASVAASADRAADHHIAAAQQVSLSWSQAMDAVRAGMGSMTTSGGATATANEIRDAAQKGRYFGPVDAFGNPDYAKLGLDQPSAASGWSAGNTTWGHRAAGGPVSAGSPYMVGERGPELFVPDRGGSIVPNGGGTTVVANIYVNGTGTDVARVINAELTRLMRVGRKWPSV